MLWLCDLGLLCLTDNTAVWLTSKEEITVGSATVINLAGFEEEDCSNWSGAVLLVSRRFFWVLPLPNHGWAVEAQKNRFRLAFVTNKVQANMMLMKNMLNEHQTCKRNVCPKVFKRNRKDRNFYELSKFRGIFVGLIGLHWACPHGEVFSCKTRIIVSIRTR